MSQLADDLERLCCAETEGKFFDLVTDNIATIVAALRTTPPASTSSPVGETAAFSQSDMRFGINVVLETIAKKFEAWDTFDLWRSDAAQLVRSYKHATPPAVSDSAGAEDWRDPSTDERWQAGLDYAMEQFCHVLRVDPKDVTWDAATEELEGDVRSVIGNILRVKYGEDFDPKAAHPARGPHREAIARALLELKAMTPKEFKAYHSKVDHCIALNAEAK